MSQSVLSKTFAVSLLLHAGLLGLLLLEAPRRPVLFDSPLRVQILEPPASPPASPAASQPLPAPERRPNAGRGSREVPGKANPPAIASAKPQAPIATDTVIPRPVPVPDKPAIPAPEKPRVLEAPAPPAASPPPQVAARPTPEPAVPRTERIPDPPRDTPPPATSERGGLSMGGPSSAAPRPPASGADSATGRAGRPSLRDQIASLGSGLTGDLGGAAKRTISLDSREEVFVDYLARLKRRVQGVWEYPEEAIRNRISGELLLIFTLNSGGSLTFIRLVQSSGFPILDEEALRAVKLAAPFDSFPSQMGDEPLNIQATFHYDMSRRSRRN